MNPAFSLWRLEHGCQDRLARLWQAACGASCTRLGREQLLHVPCSLLRRRAPMQLSIHDLWIPLVMAIVLAWPVLESRLPPPLQPSPSQIEVLWMVRIPLSVLSALA